MCESVFSDGASRVCNNVSATSQSSYAAADHLLPSRCSVFSPETYYGFCGVCVCVCARSSRICERRFPQKLRHIDGQLPLCGDVTALLVILHCSQDPFFPSPWVTPPTGSTVKHFDALVSMGTWVNWGDAGIISLFAECSVWSGCCWVFRRESRRLF